MGSLETSLRIKMESQSAFQAETQAQNFSIELPPRSKLRRYGYFHQVVVFCVLHTAYFGLKTTKFLLESLTVTQILPQVSYQDFFFNS